MKKKHSPDPAYLAAQWMSMEIISDLFASTRSGQLPQKLTEELREFTGARTVLLLIHPDSPGSHEILYVCPPRRASLFSTGILDLFCPDCTPEELPPIPADLPTGHFLREPLLQVGIESLLRFPLHAAGELVGSLILFDMPEPARIDELSKAIQSLSPLIAMALKNALSHQRIEMQAQELEKQARELERRVAERTAELEEANKALRESEGRLHRAVICSPFPIMIHAEDGEVLMISDVWTEITGYSRGDIPTIGAWTEQAYGQRKPFVQEDINRLYGLTEKIKEGEYVIRTKSGDRCMWDFMSAPLGALSDGRRIAISMATDITQRKQAEEALLLTRFSIEHASDAIFWIMPDSRIVDINEAACRSLVTPGRSYCN